MHARIAKEEVSLLLSNPRTNAAEQVEAIRLAAARARDAAVVDGVRNAFAWVASTVTGWFEARRAEAELSALNDRELADLGLTRADISSVIRKGR